MKYKLGAYTDTFMTIRIEFWYKYSIDTTKGTATVDYYLTPAWRASSPDYSYLVSNGKQTFSITANSETKVDWEKSASYTRKSKDPIPVETGGSISISGQTVYRSYARAGGNVDIRYNGIVWRDTNADNIPGKQRNVFTLGSAFESGSFVVKYPTSGKATFTVKGNFAWYNSTRRKFSKTITLDDELYTLTYNANGGTNSGTSKQYKKKNVDVRLKTGADFSKTGYDLVNWLDENSGKWALGSTYSTNKSRTFKANWTPKSYTITYNSNEPIWIAYKATNMPENNTKKYGKDFAVSSVIPKLAGYDFKGWSLLGGSDNTVDYKSGSTYKGNKTTTFFAVWNPTEYKLSLTDYFTRNTIKTIPIKYYNIVAEEYLSYFDNYSKNGYKLLGWSPDVVPVYKKDPDPIELAKILFDPTARYTYTKDLKLYPVLQYTTSVYVKVGDQWKLAMPYVKVGDQWKQALSYVKNDTWKI